MTRQKFHREVYWPEVRLPAGAFRLQATAHAKEEFLADRYWEPGDELPEFVQLKPSEVFEVTLEGGRLLYLVERSSWDEERDLVMVLRPATQTTAVLITCWFNDALDVHRSLDRSKYAVAG